MRFSPTAWSKLLFCRDRGRCEVGAFGISHPADPLYVQDLVLLTQECTWGSVCFDDASVADYFDAQVDRGLQPEQFARIWLHTHPADCPRPSLVDEETFSRVFGRADWAVMGIVAQDGSTYARLRFAAGPGGSLRIPIEVDFSRPFAATDQAAWEAEYRANVREASSSPWPDRPRSANGKETKDMFADWQDVPADWYDELFHQQLHSSPEEALVCEPFPF